MFLSSQMTLLITHNSNFGGITQLLVHLEGQRSPYTGLFQFYIGFLIIDKGILKKGIANVGTMFFCHHICPNYLPTRGIFVR